jgi:hypothetical protein
MEVASMILNEAASYLDMVTEAVYEKAYPESWGAAVDRTNTPKTSIVINNLRVEGTDLRREQLDRIMREHAENARKHRGCL